LVIGGRRIDGVRMRWSTKKGWYAYAVPAAVVLLCTIPARASAESGFLIYVNQILYALLLSDDAPAYILNDTGIDWAGDFSLSNSADCSTNHINVNSLQDCHQGRDSTNKDDSDGHAGFSFTELTGGACVKDNVTGLVWEVKTNDDSIHDKDNTYRWGGKTHLGEGYGTYYNDWDTLVDGSNNANFCGYDDWRVSTINELENLVSLDRLRPTIDTDYFPNLSTDAFTQATLFWSASPSANDTESAWYVDFSYGASRTYLRTQLRPVRLVRGGF
jgi:hypothetical protein